MREKRKRWAHLGFAADQGSRRRRAADRGAGWAAYQVSLFYYAIEQRATKISLFDLLRLYWVVGGKPLETFAVF
jgi:hypothetical protein